MQTYKSRQRSPRTNRRGNCLSCLRLLRLFDPATKRAHLQLLWRPQNTHQASLGLPPDVSVTSVSVSCIPLRASPPVAPYTLRPPFRRRLLTVRPFLGRQKASPAFRPGTRLLSRRPCRSGHSTARVEAADSLPRHCSSPVFASVSGFQGHVALSRVAHCPFSLSPPQLKCGRQTSPSCAMVARSSAVLPRGAYR